MQRGVAAGRSACAGRASAASPAGRPGTAAGSTSLPVHAWGPSQVTGQRLVRPASVYRASRGLDQLGERAAPGAKWLARGLDRADEQLDGTDRSSPAVPGSTSRRGRTEQAAHHLSSAPLIAAGTRNDRAERPQRARSLRVATASVDGIEFVGADRGSMTSAPPSESEVGQHYLARAEPRPGSGIRCSNRWSAGTAPAGRVCRASRRSAFPSCSMPSRPLPSGASTHQREMCLPLLILGEPDISGAPGTTCSICSACSASRRLRKLAAGVELLYQSRATSRLDLAENTAHLLAGLLVDQPGRECSRVLAVVGHRPYIGDAALYISPRSASSRAGTRSTRTPAGSRPPPGGEAGLDSVRRRRRRDRLLAEQVSLGLFGERALQRPRGAAIALA